MKSVLKMIVAAYGVYLVIAFVIINPALNHFLGSIYKSQTGRELRYESAGFNPFTLALYLDQSSDINPDGSILWSAGSITVNPSLSSLLEPGIVLDSFRIHGLHLHAQKLTEDLWVFSDILKHIESTSNTTENATANHATDNNTSNNKDSKAAIPGLSVNNIFIHINYLGYSDLSKQEAFTAQLKNISIELENFSTLAEESRPYRFLATGEYGGEIEWQGRLSLRSENSNGRIELRNIALLPAWRFMKSDVNFTMHSGRLSAGADYKLSWQDPEDIRYSVNKGNINLAELKLSHTSDESAKLSLKSIGLNDISLDSETQIIHSPQGEVTALQSTLTILEDGTTNFNQMFTPVSSSEQEEANPQPKSNNAPWLVDIQKVDITETEFFFNDHSITPQFSTFISDFNGTINNISNRADTVTAFAFTGRADDYAPVSLDGTVQPDASPLTAQAKLDFSGIELNAFSPYSGTYAGRKIEKGLLSVQLDYSLKENTITGKNHVVIDQLSLGEKVESPVLSTFLCN